MTTQDLIARLRDTSALSDPLVTHEAADALEAQGREIERLKRDIQRQTEAFNAVADALNKAAPERDTLRAELEAIRGKGQSSVVAGALYDFMGWLTSRRTQLVLSDRDPAGPAVDAIVDFSKMRGLHLDDADVKDWQTKLASPVSPATGVEVNALAKRVKRIANEFFAGDDRGDKAAARAIMAMEVEANKALTSDAALSQSQPAHAGVVEGWKLVPVEPTPEMIRQGRITPCTADELDADDDYRAVYKSMLSAAPQQKKEGV